MCFSATASFTAGTALLVVGAVTVTRVRRAAELPFALIPVLFGIQQLVEGWLWLTFPSGAQPLNMMLTHVYSFFSHVLWPMYVPIAVLLIEPVHWRRRVLMGISVVGVGVGLFLLYYLLSLPIVSQVTGSHIRYVSAHFFIIAVMIAYVLGTCVSSLLSSHAMVRLFGVAAFLSFLAAGAFYAFWFISVWCFFAAVLSSTVLLYFVRRSPEVAKGTPDRLKPLEAG